MTADPTELLRDAAPGTLLYGFSAEPDLQIDVLVRESSAVIQRTANRGDLEIRGGFVGLEGVFVVVVLFALDPDAAVYQSFWNFHHPEEFPGDGNIFHHMGSEQNELVFKLLGDSGKVERVLLVRHPLQSFFRQTTRRLASLPAWNVDQFHAALALVVAAHPTPRALWDSLG